MVCTIVAKKEDQKGPYLLFPPFKTCQQIMQQFALYIETFASGFGPGEATAYCPYYADTRTLVIKSVQF